MLDMDKDMEKITTNKLIHFGALLPTKAINNNHVNQILGFGNHSSEMIASTLEELSVLKKDVREWAGEQLKTKMTEVARAMGNDPLTMKMQCDGKEISTFNQLKLWWSNPYNQQNEQARNSIFYCAYGYFEDNPGWDENLERVYMNKFHLNYTAESKQSIQDQCRRRGFKKKGCIAMNIAMVKHELVKQLQKAGRLYVEGMTFTKNRPKGKDVDDDNKRRKKGVYYYNKLDDDGSPKKKKIEEKVSKCISKHRLLKN
jgi:hypothetical protein